MANIKFSQFTQKTTLGTVDFLVGYTGADNVQISPTNLLSDYPTGSGATGRVAFWEPSNNLSSDYLFKWDNSNNRLGIGVEHPATTLHAVTADDTIAKFESSDNKAAISISDDDTTGYFSAENGRIGFGTGLGASSSNISILTSNSNVGIGTVSPSAKLEVDGTFISTGISQLGSSGSNVLLTSSSAGNVGIGTSSPSNKLVVNGTVHLGSNGSDVTIGASNSSVIFMLRSGYNYIQASDASGALMFRTGGNNNRMIIDSSGNVGIGTTSPQAALHVAGAFDTTAPTGDGVLMGSYNSAYGAIQLNGTSGSFIDFSTSGTDHKGRILYNNSTNYLRFDTNGTEKVRILSNGDVGIGTTSPADRLDVAGNIRWTGDATNAGNGNLIMGGGQIKFSDAGRFYMGDSNDLALEHNGSFSQITNATGDFYIQNTADDKDIIFRSDDGSGGLTAYFQLDGGSSRTLFSKNQWLTDNVKILLGNNDDLQIYHSGSNSIIQDSGTGHLNIQGTNIQLLNSVGNKYYATFADGAQVKLFYNGVEKFETTNTGATVTGTLIAATGDLETSGVGYGLILKSPNGTRYRVTVDNSGNLSTTAV